MPSVLKFLSAVVLAFAGIASLHAQATDATICDILAAPKSFDGKIVRIKGTVIAGFDEFSIRDTSCNRPINAIWLAYPEGTKGKAGPVAILTLQLAKNSPGEATAPRPAVTLDKSADFTNFDTLLSTPVKTPGRCLGCVRSTVTATLTGRIDAVAEPTLKKDASGKFTEVTGFGNLNKYPARLVLQAVAEVAAQEIDYSKSAKLPKNDSDNTKGDPVAGAHAAAKVFGAGNPAGDQIERAAAAFGKQGEDNGVGVGFGSPGELVPSEEGKGSGSSPDGLLYNTRFDMSRLKGNALAEAIVHEGQMIADLRAGHLSDNLYQLEGAAWQAMALSVVANREKSYTLPDGGIAWSANWTTEERGKAISAAIDIYLNKWVGLER